MFASGTKRHAKLLVFCFFLSLHFFFLSCSANCLRLVMCKPLVCCRKEQVVELEKKRKAACACAGGARQNIHSTAAQFHATAASKSGPFTECRTMLPTLVFLPLVYMHDARGPFEFDGHLVREQDHECRVGLPLS